MNRFTNDFTTRIRRPATPFEWHWSYPRLVADCLDDGFSNYLDRGKLRRAAHLKHGGSSHTDYQAAVDRWQRRETRAVWNHVRMRRRLLHCLTACLTACLRD